MRKTLLIFFLLTLACIHVTATTWNEPWHDEVVRLADIFVKVQIVETSGSRAKAKILKVVAGTEAGSVITVQGYSKLQLGSLSATDELALPFHSGNEYYLLVKRDAKTGSYSLPTPTSGWAWIESGNVYATYRHSYHQALVPSEIYEKTMLAIFNAAKNKPIDETVATFVKTELTETPARLSDDLGSPETKRFFLQHVALETVFHTGIGSDLKLLKPFLEFSEPQTQISAARAIGRIRSPEALEILIRFIEGKGVGFAKVMCVWALRDQSATMFESRLRTFAKEGRDEETGFGGSIMDPRVGTVFPESVKAAIREVLEGWKTREAANLVKPSDLTIHLTGA